jgi:hypothetical protein
MCTPVTPAVPYLLLGLQDVQWAVGNSRGARKLARTPHVNQKKKKKDELSVIAYDSEDVEEQKELLQTNTNFWVENRREDG